MPSRDRSRLLGRFLEELSISLDIQQTIKKLDIAEEEARAMLRGLIPPEKKAAALGDLFGGGAEAGAARKGKAKGAEEAVKETRGPTKAGEAAHPAKAAHHAQKAAGRKGAYTINVDGASRGNPGEAGAGALIKDPEGRVLKKLKKYLGIATNNMAEYQALVMALEAARSLKLESIRVLADSELMVKQINGVYRVKSHDLRPLYERAVALLKGFRDSRVAHVYREENAAADSLANEAIDGSR